MGEPRYSERFVTALQCAARWHQTQIRKGTGIPYISHPLRVCAIVLDDGGGEDEACAALLHDSVEDTSATLDDVAALFGDNVARIVRMCSDDEGQGEVKPPWRRRKEQHLEHLRADPAFDAQAARVMGADKLANMTSQLEDGPTPDHASWDRFKGGIAGTLWYLETATGIISAKLGPDSALPARLEAGLADFRALRYRARAGLGGLDVRIAEALDGVPDPGLQGWTDAAVELASFEIARQVRMRDVDPRRAALTVLVNWFGQRPPRDAPDRAAQDAALDAQFEGLVAAVQTVGV